MDGTRQIFSQGIGFTLLMVRVVAREDWISFQLSFGSVPLYIQRTVHEPNKSPHLIPFLLQGESLQQGLWRVPNSIFNYGQWAEK